MSDGRTNKQRIDALEDDVAALKQAFILLSEALPTGWNSFPWGSPGYEYG